MCLCPPQDKLADAKASLASTATGLSTKTLELERAAANYATAQEALLKEQQVRSGRQPGGLFCCRAGCWDLGASEVHPELAAGLSNSQGMQRTDLCINTLSTHHQSATVQ